jgi:hypothetical protein
LNPPPNPSFHGAGGKVGFIMHDRDFLRRDLFVQNTTRRDPPPAPRVPIRSYACGGERSHIRCASLRPTIAELALLRNAAFGPAPGTSSTKKPALWRVRSYFARIAEPYHEFHR